MSENERPKGAHLFMLVSLVLAAPELLVRTDHVIE